jgi:hypothetical protein
MKHKHYDLILAWANGAEIQNEYKDKVWIDEEYPFWYPDNNYRIKPELASKPVIKVSQDGMDLRDYFAIQYINGVISNPNFYAQTPFGPLAQMGYSMADEMMKARVA